MTARLSGVQCVRAELRTELLHLVDAFLYVVYTGCILETSARLWPNTAKRSPCSPEPRHAKEHPGSRSRQLARRLLR